MSALSIPCPKCDANLKIPSRKYLGKKAKCPKCEHRFVLEEPAEVELQLASTVAVTSQPAEPQIPLGLNPVWVPDPGTQFATTAAPVTPTTVAAPLASAAQPADVAVRTSPPVPSVGQPPAAESATPASAFDFAAPATVPEAAPEAPAAENSAAPAAAKQAPRGRRRRSGSRGATIALSVGSALFVACMGGLFWQQTQQPDQPTVAQKQAPQKNEAWEQDKQVLAAANAAAEELSPTNGTEIPIQYMPFTPHLICHMRPAELWAADGLHREFIATCGHLGQWLQERISTITRFEPQEIEELTFAINFGPRTTPPQVAAVVRLKSEQRPSDLQLNRFKGQVRPDLSTTIYESDDYSFMPIDNKTFVVAPITMSDSLAKAKDYGELPMVDLEKVLKHTDRNRQFTLAFDLVNIDTHREYIFGDEMQDFADRFVLWFGKEVKTIGFSLHLQQQQFFVETLLSPTAGNSPMTVRRAMQGRLEKLPEEMMAATRMMQPSVEGYRQMIGRFPAMLKATFLGTTANVDTGIAKLVSYLPPQAAANLAAASLYTWNQSVVTDFSQVTVATSAGQGLPETVAGRLQLPVLVDFRRMPLQEAFAYIGDEIKTTIEINGDALKLAGMTQNMPQTYNLGEISALKAIEAIVGNADYKGELVVVVDEPGKKIIVTSLTAANQAGLTILAPKK